MGIRFGGGGALTSGLVECDALFHKAVGGEDLLKYIDVDGEEGVVDGDQKDAVGLGFLERGEDGMEAGRGRAGVEGRGGRG